LIYSHPLYPTDNIIIGLGEVPAHKGAGNKIQWVMPGNIKTSNREEAIACAIEIDRLIRRSMETKK